MKRALLAAVAVVLLMPGTALAKRHDQLPLHLHSAGPRVAALQWMLAGHKPNVFRKVKGTYHGKPSGYFGAATAKALYAYKYRIGYPMRWNLKNHPQAGGKFFAFLEGKKKWPKGFVAAAAHRLQAVVPGATPMALKIKDLEVAELGVTEQPLGCNCGPRISYAPTWWHFHAFQYFTGAYDAAWCASFQQWGFAEAGYGTFANHSAGVLYIEQWAQYHGFLSAKAKVGDLVAFLDDGGHIGFITKVLGSGYVSLEGNSSDRVQEVYHPWNDRLRVFIDLPGVG